MRGRKWVFKSDFYKRGSVHCAVRTGSLNQIFIAETVFTARYGLGL